MTWGRSAFAPALLRFGGRDRGACRAQHLTHTHTHTAGGLEGRAADAPPPRSLLQGLNDRARLWLGGDVPSGRVGRRARAGRACTRGTEKASVLPDPVGASMSRSRCVPGRRDRPLLLDLVQGTSWLGRLGLSWVPTAKRGRGSEGGGGRALPPGRKCPNLTDRPPSPAGFSRDSWQEFFRRGRLRRPLD